MSELDVLVMEVEPASFSFGTPLVLPFSNKMSYKADTWSMPALCHIPCTHDDNNPPFWSLSCIKPLGPFTCNDRQKVFSMQRGLYYRVYCVWHRI